MYDPGSPVFPENACFAAPQNGSSEYVKFSDIKQNLLVVTDTSTRLGKLNIILM